MQYKIVVLDGFYANPGDLSWDELKKYGLVEIYERTNPDQVIERSKDANIIIINKVVIGKSELAQLPHLQLIIISATGMNNVDLEEAQRRNIPVKNVSGYSTQSVTQHVFSMIFELTNQVARHNLAVKSGAWNDSVGFSFTKSFIPELHGKTFGIYGFGAIGQSVSNIAVAFGMQVMITSNHANPAEYPEFQFGSVQDLFRQCDIISLHAPLRDGNMKIVDKNLLDLMKPSAFLINTARGPLINEQDLYQSLKEKQIAGAALDVLETEPPGEDHPLFQLDNCIITPHMAWASRESRAELIDKVTEHVADFVS